MTAGERGASHSTWVPDLRASHGAAVRQIQVKKSGQPLAEATAAAAFLVALSV